MRITRHIHCDHFPCSDVKHDCFILPNIEVRPSRVSVVLISEAAPADPADYYYTKGNPLFAQTTLQAFADAGVNVKSIRELVALGVYLTTAVKCAKTGYGIATATVKECSHLLERELALFPNVKAYLLMGDVAIRSLNYIAERASPVTRTGQGRIIPAGSTYKIRGGTYYFRGARVFPSYLQAGPSFFIEKSKRGMIAQDIKAAMVLS